MAIFSFSSQGHMKVVPYGLFFSISSQGNMKFVLCGLSISSQGHRAASLRHVPIQQAVAAGSEWVRTKAEGCGPTDTTWTS